MGRTLDRIAAWNQTTETMIQKSRQERSQLPVTSRIRSAVISDFLLPTPALAKRMKTEAARQVPTGAEHESEKRSDAQQSDGVHPCTVQGRAPELRQ